MTANRSTGVCETYVMRWHRCRCTDMRWIRFTCERRVSLMEMHPEEMPSCVPVAGMRLVHPFGWSRDFAGKRHSFGRSIRIGCWCSPVMPFFLLSSTATAANSVFRCRCGCHCGVFPLPVKYDRVCTATWMYAVSQKMPCLRLNLRIFS